MVAVACEGRYTEVPAKLAVITGLSAIRRGHVVLARGRRDESRGGASVGVRGRVLGRAVELELDRLVRQQSARVGILQSGADGHRISGGPVNVWVDRQ